MVKIKEYKVGQRGLRGSVISIPSIFVDDNDIKPGDTIEIYRENLAENGRDALIIIPKEKIITPTENISTPAS